MHYESDNDFELWEEFSPEREQNFEVVQEICKNITEKKDIIYLLLKSPNCAN